jgi:hypothetical protein
VDPGSLRRLSPEVHAWFAAAEHLKLSAAEPETDAESSER